MIETDNLKKIPSSIEAEKSLLCGIFLLPQKIDDVIEIIKAEDFYKKAHKNIFNAMLKLYEKNDIIDIRLVVEELKRLDKYEESGGEEVLRDILEEIPTPANILSYGQIVHDKAILREIGNVGTKVVEMVYDENEDTQTILDRAESMIFKISENKDSKSVFQLKEAIHEEMMRIDKVYKTKGLTGLSSGYSEFDAKTGGFHKSDLIILAARPAMGKTAFALNLTLNVAKEKHSVLIFSLEMSKSQLMQRFLAVDASIELSKIKNGFLDDKDLGMIGASAGRLAGMNIHIADIPYMNVMEIRNIARKMKAIESLDLIVIDYLQLINGGRSGKAEFNRQQEISDISRSLKGIARELDVPIIALSQLSRAVESRTDKRPELSDLRESGSIEQDADIVMFLYRDEYYNENSDKKGIVDVIIKKHRNGPTGEVKLRFFSELTKFSNLEKEYE
jgi:replicative DNA helicase